MVNIIKLIRPYQWVKNFIIFLPIFFSGQLSCLDCWCNALWIFISFCFASSAVYCFNDIHDVEYDRHHPTKCNRPIASGVISVKKAYFVLIGCILLCFLFLIPLKLNFIASFIVLIYLLINIAYSLDLKDRSIIDIICISLGFVLRIVAGGVSTGIWISQWIVMMTFLLSMMLSSSKRKNDIILKEQSNISTRHRIEHYSIEYLNVVQAILASVTMVCYVMYTMSPDVQHRLQSNYLYTTSVFVIVGILRYLQQTIVRSEHDCDPTKILIHDRLIQFCIIGWIIMFAVIIYI